MSGKLTVSPKGSKPQPLASPYHQKPNLQLLTSNLSKHDHVIFETAKAVIIYNDPRRFGLMLLVPTQDIPVHPLFAHLGPEPLGEEFTGATLRAALKGKSAPLKVAIMDQRVVVGVGNIYASESLFRARLNPKMKAGKLTTKQADVLAACIKQVLTEAIAAGGSSLRDYRQSGGELGYFQHNFKVYDRKGGPCPVCATPIKQALMGQRSTYWCPVCQK